MGLFKKKDKTTPTSSCEYDEISLKTYTLSSFTSTRKMQLAALFVLLKKKFPGAEYSINTNLKEFRIPEEFESAEIMTISKQYEVKEWNIFIDNEHYVDIDLTTVKVNGELSMIDSVRDTIKLVEKIGSDISVTSFVFNQYAEWLWDKYLESQYDICVKLGNKYLKFGDFYVYDNEFDEFKIENKRDFELIKDRIQYIVLKSKLNSYKIVFIDQSKRQVLVTELDELEKQYLSELLHPNIES